MGNDPLDLDPKQELNKLATGRLLIARSTLQDPNFDSTVVLLGSYNKEGSYGLVLNRPSHMPLSEVFNGVQPERSENREIFIGGPVQNDELQILQLGNQGLHGAHEIAPKVYLGGHWPDLESILSFDLDAIRLFLGYSGWGAGQLESEIALGAWEVIQTDIFRLLKAGDDPWKLGNKEFRRYLSRL